MTGVAVSFFWIVVGAILYFVPDTSDRVTALNVIAVAIMILGGLGVIASVAGIVRRRRERASVDHALDVSHNAAAQPGRLGRAAAGTDSGPRT